MDGHFVGPAEIVLPLSDLSNLDDLGEPISQEGPLRTKVRPQSDRDASLDLQPTDFLSGWSPNLIRRIIAYLARSAYSSTRPRTSDGNRSDGGTFDDVLRGTTKQFAALATATFTLSLTRIADSSNAKELLLCSLLFYFSAFALACNSVFWTSILWDPYVETCYSYVSIWLWLSYINAAYSLITLGAWATFKLPPDLVSAWVIHLLEYSTAIFFFLANAHTACRAISGMQQQPSINTVAFYLAICVVGWLLNIAFLHHYIALLH